MAENESMETENKSEAKEGPSTPSSPPSPEEEVRDILISNLDMRRLIELDACTRCGECLTWCPVYDQDAKESIIPRAKVTDFLSIIRSQQGLIGRIVRSEKGPQGLKKLIAAVFGYQKVNDAQVQEFVRNLYECSTCGQCHIVCPAKIDTVNLWEDIRRLIVRADYGPLESQKALVKSVKSYDNPWQQPRAGRTKWARRAKKDGVFGKDEKCCGSVMLRMGDPEFERIADDNIKMFNETGFDTLISSCAGCFKTIKEDYPKVGHLNFEVLHTVEFLRRLHEKGKLNFKTPVEKKVTYHDPCHLGRASGVYDDPRYIMAAIPGLELIEMPRNREYSRCCGAGGGLKSGYPDIQNRMAQRRVKEAEETGATELVSACPFCFQGLQVGISATDSPLVMRDISFLVEASLQDEKAEKPKKERKARKARKPREPKTEKPVQENIPSTDS